jgi:hypothetical protein
MCWLGFLYGVGTTLVLFTASVAVASLRLKDPEGCDVAERLRCAEALQGQNGHEIEIDIGRDSPEMIAAKLDELRRRIHPHA